MGNSNAPPGEGAGAGLLEQEDNSEYGEFEAPSMVLALKHADASGPHRLVDKEVVKYQLWKTTPLELGSLGVGVGLYFETLRLLGYFLIAMAVLHGTILLLCAAAFKTVEDPSIYQPLTAYTLGAMYSDPAVPSSTRVSLAGTSVSKKTLLLAMAILDASATVLFLASLVCIKVWQRHATLEIDDATITLGDFAIQVKRLPTGATDADIRTHFSQFGEIVDVAIARNDGNLLRMLERQQHDVAQLGRLTALIAKTKGHQGIQEKARLEEKLLEDEASIAYLLKERPFEVVAAFATFDDEDARFRCISSYSDSLPGIYAQPKRLRFLRKKRIAVRAAPEPEDVLWENLEVGYWARWSRRIGSALFTLVLLCITTGFMIAAKGYDSRLPPEVNCEASAKRGTLECPQLWNLTATTGNADPVRVEVHSLKANTSGIMCRPVVFNGLFRANVTAVAANATAAGLPLPTTEIIQCAAATCYSCFCKTTGLSAAVNDALGLGSYCRRYWLNVTLTYVFKALAVVTATVINTILYAVMPWLSSLERHHLLTAQEAATAEKLFITQLLNCAVIGTLVYAHIAGLSRGKVTNWFFNGLYEDFDTAWYSAVGSTLVITLTVQIVVPFINEALGVAWAWGKRWLWAKSQLIQSDLNKLMEGLEFTLADRYGQLLTLIFVAMVFSAGIPILHLILTAAIHIIYWVDKITLLRLSRTPAQYDDTMTNAFLATLPWAAWIHCAVAVWMYGGLPSNTFGEAQDALGGRIPQPTRQLNWTDRITKANAAPALALFLLLTIYLLARPFYNGARALAALFWRSNQVRDENLAVTLRQALKDECVSGLRSYQRTANPRYHLAQRTAAFVRTAEAPTIADRLEVTKSRLPSFLQRYLTRGRVSKIGRELPDPPEKTERQKGDPADVARERLPGTVEKSADAGAAPRSSARLANESGEKVRGSVPPSQWPGLGKYGNGMTEYGNGDDPTQLQQNGDPLSARAAAELDAPGFSEGLHGLALQPEGYVNRVRFEGEQPEDSMPASGSSRNGSVSRFPTSNAKIGR
ncbi:hypothetical protein KFL_000770270 [Klebsormidium nitens]|uniref:RRM domain-containing protein n=1 Tax=Klebsormidium nitens TaxID=105231 RepID=A0A1Y1HRS1_KLENI|nr:hypothetical protein KFL_000770270 [Klebsormidium nitens]|eukprot:GAQ81334.1 hypothetical protein KFL_000770270 [Klebsormidium nitens]